ncbi:hypothetical protein PQR53_15730 [Paraburkholderia fungorum]|uniref:hypothetical protein n=1 Tax=Paraburkholderia fungorum TaxID=134537 RepID=UPI0038BBC193
MSTTIPLTLIEGSMALPSLSPLCRLLPPPFGRDWALLPPGHSLRAELRTLYVAVLRTFCLNAEAISTLCQWEASRRLPAASSAFILRTPSTSVVDAAAEGAVDAPVEGLVDASVEGSVDTSFDGSLRTAAEAAPFAPVNARGVPASPRGGSGHWGALAGGACALGGAAILAWIAVGHLTQRHTIGDAKTAGKVPVGQEAKLANHHSPDAAVTSRATNNDRAAARATTDKNVSRRQDRLREGAPIQYEKSGRNSRTAIAAHLSPQLPPQLPPRLRPRLPPPSSTNHEGSPIAVSANAHRTSPKPLSTGPYSPHAPSQPGIDEYMSMTMSAGTPVRDLASPSRPAGSVDSPRIGGTDWTNHMSQRRVTENPDQFAK